MTLEGPLVRHFVNTREAPRYWQVGPAEAVAAPAVGGVMVIFMVAELVLMVLCDARLVRRHLKMARRNLQASART